MKDSYSNTLWKLVLLIINLIFIISNLYAQSEVDSSKVVRVLTFNIYHGETVYAEKNFDLDLLAKVINDVKPDLVALQEVDFKTMRAKNMDLVTELGKRTKLAPLFGKAMPFRGGEYGVGILSKMSFLNAQNHPYNKQEGKEPRTALEANVIKSGDTIRFISTHLDHKRDATNRISQAHQLNNKFTKDNRPTILAGDLNARPESEVMNILYKEWKQSFSDNIPTAPAINPRAKIDYILFRPAHKWRILETNVINEKVASDHRPVLSVLELLNEQ